MILGSLAYDPCNSAHGRECIERDRVELIQVSDAAFLRADSPEHPMHIGTVLVFEPPKDAGPNYLSTLIDRVAANTEVSRTFRKYPEIGVGGVGNLMWAHDEKIDVGYHIRRAALPAPGTLNELFTLVSKLHSTQLDPARPLWQACFVSGLPDGRFALYFKVHHALIDSTDLIGLIDAMLSDDAAAESSGAPWHVPHTPTPTPQAEVSVSSLLRFGGKQISGLASLVPDTAKVASAIMDRSLAVPFRAPKTILNVPVDAERVFAGRSFSMERINNVHKFSRAPITAIVLAMCSGALRTYLREAGPLPGSSLVAMVPAVKRTSKGIESKGSFFCRLGTDLQHPEQRLAMIKSSIDGAKLTAESVGLASTMVMSVASMTPKALSGIAEMTGVSRPPFNIGISYVTGWRIPVFWNGSRLNSAYPVSIVTNGLALAVAATSTQMTLDIGVTACPRAVSDIGRFVDLLETALFDLETIYH